MAGDLSMPESFPTKEAMYKYIYEHLKEHLEALKDCHSKFDNQLNLFTALANASSLLYYAMNSYHVGERGSAASASEAEGATPFVLPLHKAVVNWVGFYLIADAQYMVLGPFQGKVACTRIKIGRGVCGTAVLLGKTQCIPNVHEFPGHIACDSGSESEIVVPIRDNSGRIVGVLDIDSTVRSRFDEVDVMRLTDIVVLISQNVAFPNATEVRARNMEPLDGRRANALPTAPHHPFPSGPNANIAAATITPATAATSTVLRVTQLAAGAGGGGSARALSTSASADSLPSSLPASPLTKEKSLGDWTIRIKRLDRIISAGEIARWEEAHSVGSIPEIVFPQNGLEMVFLNKKTKVRTTLTIDAESYFVSAAAFYKTRNGAKSLPSSKGASAGDITTVAAPTSSSSTSASPPSAAPASGSSAPALADAQRRQKLNPMHASDEAYDTMKEEQSFLQIPVAESWKNTKFGKYDPNIDWASRSNFICSVRREDVSEGLDAPRLIAGEEDEGGAADPSRSPYFARSLVDVVNYDMLKRRDMEILAYDSFDLFEDDLHDCGISKCSVKVRVMPLCIFVLVRHVVRVDAAAAVVRDVRLYSELAPVDGVAGIIGKTPEKPFVVAEVTYKQLVFPSSPIGVAPGSPQQQTRQVEARARDHLMMSLDELVEQMTQTLPAKNYVLRL